MRRHWARSLGGLGIVLWLGSVPAEAQLPANLPYDGRVVLEPRLPDVGTGHNERRHRSHEPRSPVDSIVTLSVTDSTFMKYPVAMVTEPGCWNPTDAEVKAIRGYLEKGGFLLLDDLTFSDATLQHMELATARTEACDNDPSKPLLAVVTYQGVLGHHWRWVGGWGRVIRRAERHIGSG